MRQLPVGELTCMLFLVGYQWTSRSCSALRPAYSLRVSWSNNSSPLRKEMITTSSYDAGARKRRPLVLVVAGPTAVGKSLVAAQLCSALSGIVVSSDSVQAYAGVSVGANKPTEEEWLETPHLLVDMIRDMRTAYSAAAWRRDALFAISTLTGQRFDESSCDDSSADVGADQQRQQSILDTLARARHVKAYDEDNHPFLVPIVCGGTMMYQEWLLRGIPDAVQPTATATTRAESRIDDLQQDQMDWSDVTATVTSEVGEPFGNQIAKLSGNDYYRLRRILEVAYTMKEQSVDKDSPVSPVYTGARQGGLADSDQYDVRCFFLCPTSRLEHAHRIDERCEQMLLKGLLKEAAEGPIPEMVSKAIGYRQTLDYLSRADQTEKNAEAFQDFIKDFQAATRRYAKRQMSWFRKDSNYVFVPVDVSDKSFENNASDEILRLVNLSREDFDQERLSQDDTTNMATRRRNEAQGKEMKKFQSRHKLLSCKSDALIELLEEADACTRQYQEWAGDVVDGTRTSCL